MSSEKKSGTGTKSGMTRRDFFKTSSAAVAGAAAATLLPGAAHAGDLSPADAAVKCSDWSWEKPVSIPAAEIKQTVNTEIVVIGAGLSGIVAALSAAEQGAKVQLVDKNKTSAARGGHITAFGSKLQKEMGVKSDYRQIIRQWVVWAQGRVDEKLLWDFARKSGACMDWTLDHATRKGLKATLWEGYYKGPEYTEHPVTHIFYEDGADLSYVYGNSKGIGNVTLVPALEKAAQEAGVNFNYRTPAVKILRDDSGRVTGIITGKKGNYTQFNASKGVIIATGVDFHRNLTRVFHLKLTRQIGA